MRVTLQAVAGGVLSAACKELGVRALSMSDALLEDIQRVFGRGWEGGIPAMVVPLSICEEPPNGTPIRPAKQRFGLIVAWSNAVILGWERRWAFYAYRCYDTATTTVERTAMITKEGQRPALLLRPAAEPSIAITPQFLDATAEQCALVLGSLESTLKESGEEEV